MKTVLFQGDSITDCGRGNGLGSGYPLFVTATLNQENPNEYNFINKGISGNRIVDVYARIKADIINLKPDYMSILIGVNDVWHELSESPNGVDADKFFKIYSMLIEEVKAALPNIKIMILEPFVLEACSTTEYWDFFKTEVSKRAEMAKKIAEKYNLPFIPLQAGFDMLATKAPNEYWLGDGVHPTPAGHEYIKSQWINAFKNL